MKQVWELEQLIKYHDKLFWENNNQKISDEEYDELKQQLKSLDPNNQLLNKRYDLSASGRKKIKHNKTVLSLDKAYSIEELLTWATKISRDDNESFIIQPKFDGLTAILNGKVLATGGDDGEYGLDISDKIPIISLETAGYEGRLSLYWSHNEIDIKINIVGELILRKSNFITHKELLKRKSGEYYKTERNAAVGLFSQKETPNIPPILSFVDHDLFSLELTLKEMKEYNWPKFLSETKEIDYPTDGIVFKLKDEAYSDSLGYTSHHPHGQIALKYGNPKAQSTLLNVEWSMGKRFLTPVGIIKPTILLGHTISNVNLHNAKRVLDLDLHIGDDVIFERCGEIIPDIIEVIKGENRKEISITNCPICNGEVDYEEPNMFCVNPDCSGKLSRKLTDAVKRIGIDNLSTATIEKLIDLGISSLEEILNLDKETILTIPGFAEKSADNLLEELKRIKTSQIPDYKLLASFNLPGIGMTISKKLMKEYTLDELFHLQYTDLVNINGIGPERAELLWDFPYAIELYELRKLLNIIDTKSIKRDVVGIICITGKVPNGKEYWHKLAQENGFDIATSVTADITFLISDEGKSSTKTQKATKLGLKVITTKEFLEIIKEN